MDEERRKEIEREWPDPRKAHIARQHDAGVTRQGRLAPAPPTPPEAEEPPPPAAAEPEEEGDGED